ncbi:MAG TPA: response regulator transcription factor [Chitinophagaceae bacterium]|nr:response regulator transcription factor [Chitinophagaceae bacterium]
MPGTTSIALIDDHVLIRDGLASLVSSFPGYQALFGADNGKDFIGKLQLHQTPDIVLLDISMPIMNGFETAKWIHRNLPETKVLVLTVMDTETAIIQMLKSGAKGYIVKTVKHRNLKQHSIACAITVSTSTNW